MKRKEIHFIIGTDAGITFTVKNIKGPSCKAIAEEFKSLGKVIKETRTSEFMEKGEVKATVKSMTGRR